MPVMGLNQIREVENSSNMNNNFNATLEMRCGGCGQVIIDKYYLLAVDRAWHCHCLKCHQCGQPLESQLTCFTRNGSIFCKNDYYQLFSWQKCTGCSTPITPKQMVMRITSDNQEDSSGTIYYHEDCFACFTCNERLRKGDYFGKHQDNVYCQYHFQLLIEGLGADNQTKNCGNVFRSNKLDEVKPKIIKRKRMRRKKNSDKATGDIAPLCSPASWSSPSSPTTNSLTSCSPATQSVSSEPNSDSLQLQSAPAAKRPKRMRTSFKHHQIRSMKAYFNLNHNPDSKDLKSLAARTGLSKRVLQVWFQNQRAKWRRSLMKQASFGPQIVEECRQLFDFKKDCFQDLADDQFDSQIVYQNNLQTKICEKEPEQPVITYTNLF